MLNFTDTASDGTNRISATQIKFKNSKMSGGPGGHEGTTSAFVEAENAKQRQVGFEKEPRRSLEIDKLRSGTEIGSEVRN